LNSNQQLDWNSIKEKWDTNWWRSYWKSSCEYGVGKKKPLKRHKSQNTFICFFIWKINCDLELFNLWGFMKYKIILLKPTLTNHHNWNCLFFHFFQKSQLTVINTIKYTFHIGYNHSLKQMLVNLNLMSDNIHCFRYNYLSN
jgi:hypothetical protein